MVIKRRKSSAVAAMLVAVLFVFAGTAVGADPLPTIEAMPVEEAAAVTGQGLWAKVACIGCVAAFGVAGGGTLVGVALVLAANAELAAACAGTCIAAF